MFCLDGVWAKIEQAKQHRDMLESRIKEQFLVKNNCPHVSAEYDPGTGYYIFRISTFPDSLAPFVLSVSVSIGDIAHNLRSTLDHLAFQIARRHASRAKIRFPKSIQRNVAFPLHSLRHRRSSMPGWLDKEKTYVRLFGADAATIIERLQPYHGRAGCPDTWSGPYRHQLTLLRQISNRDKHSLPVVVAAIPNQISFGPPIAGRLLTTEFLRLNPAHYSAAFFGNASNRVELGAEVARYPIVRTGLPNKMEMAGKITPTISFPKRGPVIPTMDRIAAYVVRIVREFDPLP